MKTFITRPRKIQAIQYKFGEGVVSEIEDVDVKIIYSRDGKLYYITGGRNNRPNHWLSVEPDHIGKFIVYPFAMVSMHSGVREPIEQDHHLYIRYAEFEKWTVPSERYGVLVLRDSFSGKEDRTILNEGDWVVFESKQTCFVVPKNEFEEKYTEVYA